MNNQQSQMERYRTEIYKIGWKIQYKARKIRYREKPIFEGETLRDDFTEQLDNKILIAEIIREIPEKGRDILKKIYLEGYTEEEVARQLKISQQAVSKWKRKMLNLLSQRLNLLNC